MMNRRTFLGGMMAMGALSEANADGTIVQPNPNIVLILADDLGYGDLGCYGQRQVKTPALDRMAREGMRFTQFYAGSTVCAPSRAVLMTGLHTGHSAVRGNNMTTLPADAITLAKVLKQAGYVTGHFGKWGLGDPGSSGVPSKQGYDEFFGYLNHTHAHNNFPTHLWKHEERFSFRNVVPNENSVGAGKASQRFEFAPDFYTNEALGFITRNQRKPFCLYLAFTLPHANNEAGKEGMEIPDSYNPYLKRNWPDPQKGYAAMVTRVDTYVDWVLRHLRKLGLDRNTLVLFTSDNGPHKEGGYDPDTLDSNGQLRGIKRDLYEGGIRVPCIARWPGVVPAGKVSDHIAGFQDVMPPCAEFAGTKATTAQDGISFVPTLRGRSGQNTHDYLYWEFYEQRGSRAVRMEKWKGVRRPWRGPLELYDLDADPDEMNDIAEPHPDIVERIEAIMKEACTPSPTWPEPAA
jgi:arylsulfatase A-like enzyme